MMLPVVRSDTEGVHWPALPRPSGLLVLALLQQFEQSQWWPAEVLRRRQFEQAELLLLHASATVPFYAQRLERAGYRPDRPVTDDAWLSLPLLSREDMQTAGSAIVSTRIPAAHGPTKAATTSGSSGRPVTVLRPALLRTFARAFTIRNHLWQKHDLETKLAVIRNLFGVEAPYPEGLCLPDWGSMTRSTMVTGPSVVLAITTSVDQQLEWLTRHQPDYLLTFPSVAMELLRGSLAGGGRPTRLRQVITISEMVPPDLPSLCREVWGAGTADIYSAREVGTMALQCPETGRYHVQSEGVLLEILDDAGRPCAPGEVGRVVVTSLHNFAQPVIRYDIGDYAVAGDACRCGRGLPVLDRILGRFRNMLTLPDGRRVWPLLSEARYRPLAPVRQYQVVQTSRAALEVRLVVERPLSAEEEERLRAMVLESIGHAGFDLAFTYHDSIPRSAGGKFEDFKSEI